MIRVFDIAIRRNCRQVFAGFSLEPERGTHLLAAVPNVPLMDKGKHGFSGRKPRPASFSSLTGDGPPASSASPDTISAPEKLRRTFQRAKIGAGEEEDDGGLAPT